MSENQKELQKQLKKELKTITEQLYAMIGYISKEPKREEKTFQLLSTLMCLVDSGFLSPEEEQRCIEEMSDITDQLNGGEIRINDHHFSDWIKFAIQHIQDSNAKAHVLSATIDLEYLLSIHPPPEITAVDNAYCEELLNPFIQKIGQDQLQAYEIKPIAKNLESIKEDIINNPAYLASHLEHLKNYGKSL